MNWKPYIFPYICFPILNRNLIRKFDDISLATEMFYGWNMQNCCTIVTNYPGSMPRWANVGLTIWFVQCWPNDVCYQAILLIFILVFQCKMQYFIMFSCMLLASVYVWFGNLQFGGNPADKKWICITYPNSAMLRQVMHWLCADFHPSAHIYAMLLPYYSWSFILHIVPPYTG